MGLSPSDLLVLMAFEPLLQLGDGSAEGVTLRQQDVDVVELFSTVETMRQVRAKGQDFSKNP